MLVLYKQYIYPTDIKFIQTYRLLCVEVGESPIIFCDNLYITLNTIDDAAIFHTLYLGKLHTKIILAINSDADESVIDSLNLQDYSIIKINHDSDIKQIVKDINNDKL